MPTSLRTPRSRLVLAFAALVAASAPGAALADPAPKSAPAERDAKEPTTSPKTTVDAAGAFVLPVGDLASGVGVGLGATAGVSVLVAPHVSVGGRLGYVHHLARSGVDVTLGVVPILATARYTFLEPDAGPYLEGGAGPSVLVASSSVAGSRVTDSEVRLSLVLGGGYRFGALDAGARLATYDLGHAGSTTGVMVQVGGAFAAF